MDTVARINGIALHAPGEAVDAEALRERAYGELLRQEAVRTGHLPAAPGDAAPELDEAGRQAIERMLEAAVTVPEPGESECRRYYDANRQSFLVGQARQVRHILFAVTPGVNVPALAQRAEATLFELRNPQAAPGLFPQRAGELSNCPSGAQGGELGWLGPQDCAPELAKELFFNQESSQVKGILPRLVHTRYGLHIIEVLGIEPGQLPDFETLRPQIALRLQAQSRATALRQYMRRLAGLADIEGVEIEAATSELVQ